jgi:pimeloyl-ACP methyl ester carboxylesterase
VPTAHRIPVTDDESVAAVRHAPDPGTATDDWLVFCHGLRSDKSGSYEGRCERAVAEGFDAIRFDFRGCGEADGAFADATLSARIADLRAVVSYFGVDSATLFGSSFGGAVALHAAREDWLDAAAIATRAPVTDAGAFDDYRAVVEREGAYTFDSGERIDARFLDDFAAYHFEDVAATLDCPVAIFHGASDDSVPVADSFRAARALETDVLLQKYAGEGHRFSRAAEARMRDHLFDWLARQA